MAKAARREFLVRSMGGAAALMCLPGRWTYAGVGATGGKPAQAFNWSNWSGIQSCRAQDLLTPSTEEQLIGALRASQGNVRLFGAGHSFMPLVPTAGHLVSLDAMSGLINVDKINQIARFRAGTRLAQISRELDQQDLGLHNLPDIDAQSVAGAISTATHGTGLELRALHAEVAAMRIVKPDGSVLECDESKRPEILQAARVGLGSLGAITEVALRVRPAYNLQRKVWLKPVEDLLSAAPDLARQHRHFEFYYLPFTGYAAAITHDIYTGSDVLHPGGADEDMLRDLQRLRDWLHGMPGLRRWVAQKMIDPDQTMTAHDRSFKLLCTPRPTKFNESECHLPREYGIQCVREIIAKLEKRNDVFFPLEFRFVKADDAWLSPFYQRDSVSIAVHALQGETYDYLVSELAPIFRKYNGRPHWGKLHGHTAVDFAALYPRWNDFAQIRREIDPEGRMLNPHLKQVFGV